MLASFGPKYGTHYCQEGHLKLMLGGVVEHWTSSSTLLVESDDSFHKGEVGTVGPFQL